MTLSHRPDFLSVSLMQYLQSYQNSEFHVGKTIGMFDKVSEPDLVRVRFQWTENQKQRQQMYTLLTEIFYIQKKKKEKEKVYEWDKIYRHRRMNS